MDHRFSIDPSRLAHWTGESDAARGAAQMAEERKVAARNELAEAESQLRHVQRDVAWHDPGGQPMGRGAADNAARVGAAKGRVEAARQALADLVHAQAGGAARRDHTVQLGGRVQEYVRKANVR